jgi:hypothetical protein
MVGEFRTLMGIHFFLCYSPVEFIYQEVLSIHPNLTDESKKAMAIQYALELGRGTNAQLRKSIRPEHTPPIEFYVFQDNGKSYLVAEITYDQNEMLKRIAGKHSEFVYINKDDLKHIIGQIIA